MLAIFFEKIVFILKAEFDLEVSFGQIMKNMYSHKSFSDFNFIPK